MGRIERPAWRSKATAGLLLSAAFSALGLVLAAGCATSGATRTGRSSEDTKLRTPSPAPKVQRRPARRGLLVRLPDGRRGIRRPALADLQRLGAQSFIQKVRVRPAFKRGRFHGWRVLAYRGPGSLRHGDVVTRINGQPIERPEQFMRVWADLIRSQTFEVELLRAGRRIVYKLPIVDDRSLSSPPGKERVPIH